MKLEFRTVAGKAAEDCRTPRPSEVRTLDFVAKRLGVRQSSAAFLVADQEGKGL